MHSVTALPIGVRDYVPKAAAKRRAIVDSMCSVFRRHGYQRVVTPLFEYEEVFEQGGVESKQMIRFVDPSSARVVALRPDFTPQVARLAATRLRDSARPVRLFYEGSVLRLSGGPEPQRELVQAGVELLGEKSGKSDASVIALCAQALSAGKARAQLDLGHVALVRSLFADLTESLRPEARKLLARKAKSSLMGLPVSTGTRKRLCELASLHGGPEVLQQCRRMGPIGRETAEEVGSLFANLPAGIRRHTSLDLGEARGFDYYTGIRFAFVCPGVGEPIARGGRYDDLVARYGEPLPATGFAIDIELLLRGIRSHRQGVD